MSAVSSRTQDFFDGLELPTASHARPIGEADVPAVAVKSGHVLCDGETVEDLKAIARGPGPRRVDGLWNALKAKRDAWKATHPGEPFHGTVFLGFDGDASAAVVKSVFQTAAFAGYPYARFVVRRQDGRALAWLGVDAFVPGPPAESEPKPDAHLVVGTNAGGYETIWWKDGAKVAETLTSNVEGLRADVEKGWRAHAEHRNREDGHFDQAVMFVPNDIDYARIVAMVDAIAATERDLVVGRRVIDAPALNVSLAMAPSMGEAREADPLAPRGRLDPAVIQRVVRANFGAFRACYERGLTKNPELAGRVQVRFVIERDGSVSHAADDGSTMPDRAVTECVVRAYSKLSYPRPKGGIVTVVYPIVFRPDADEPPPETEKKGGGIGLGNP